MATEKRLINANTLLERLNDSSESWAKNLQAIRNWWPHAVGIKDNITRLIREAPTVDAVEVVHGRWAGYHEADIGYDEYGVRCSNCNFEVEDNEVDFIMNYCPNCGAKMDGVQE